VPSKFRLRRIFSPLVIKIAELFVKMKIKPNHASFLMLLCSILSFMMLHAFNNLIIFGIFVFITGLMDGVDGTIARLTSKSTKYGAFLDSTLDRVSEIIIYAALVISGLSYYRDLNAFSGVFQILVLMTIFGSLMISYLRSRATNEINADFDIGLFARSERLFTLFIISVIPFSFFYFIGFTVLSLGVISTAIYRYIRYREYFLEQNQTSN